MLAIDRTRDKMTELAAGATATGTHPKARRGESLVEMIVATVIMGSLIASFLPRFQRSLEQARADLATANLRAIWAAERLYWLENPSRTYTSDLGLLVSGKYLDAALDPASQPPGAAYSYAVSPDLSTFSATATRAAGGSWAGSFSISGDGTTSGSVQRTGEKAVVAGFQ
jgi:type II secretory pathway pseudopilin PulG